MSFPTGRIVKPLLIQVLTVLIATWMSLAMYGQEFKVIRVNTSQYPIIKVTFQATSIKNEKITDAKPADFHILENKVSCNILDVTNPSDVAIPASIVLVLDVSLSMSGNRLELAKRAARAFIEQVPLESSEIAIASFSDDVYINCDFTQNQDRLFEALETLHTVGGTSYDHAFLNETSGVLNVAGTGRNKRCVIFLTDGLSNTSSEKVIAKALEMKTTVYCITLELLMPEVLKRIAEKTGGRHYQTIANVEQLEGIYTDIFQSLEIAKYGTVTWQAVNECKMAKSAQLMFRGKPLVFNYDVPASKVGSFEIDPSLIAFGSCLPGSNKSLSLDIIARNIPITFTQLSLTGKSPFAIADTLQFPIQLAPSHVKTINVTFSPKDAKMASDKLTVSTKECPDKTALLIGGSDEQLRLVCPKGGEKLIVGTDTSVRWEGVKRSKDINIAYRTRPDRPWKPLGTGSNLAFPWLTPNDTGTQVQVKLNPEVGQDHELFLTSTTPVHKLGIRSAYLSSDAEKAISIDHNSMVRVWETKTGKLLSSFESFRSTNALFCNFNKNILSFSKNEILVWSTQSGKLIDRQPIGNTVIFTSLIAPDGTESLVTATILKDMANTFKIFIPGLNKVAFVLKKDYIVSASITIDGTKALTLNSDNELKVWDIPKAKFVTSNFQPIGPISIVINPNGRTALVRGLGSLTMIDMNSGKELFRRQQFTYKQFSSSGDMLLTKASDGSIALFDSYSGKLLLTKLSITSFKTLPTGYKIVFYKNDSIIMMDAATRQKLFQVYKPGVTDYVTSEDGTKLMAIMQSNVIDVYDVNTGKPMNRIGEISSNIRTALFSKDNRSVLAMMNNNTLQYWSSEGFNQSKEVVSGYFSIISPKPKVKKSIHFADQTIHQSRELVVSDFISNPTPYPIAITKIELIRGDTSIFEMVSQAGPVRLRPMSKEGGEFRFTPRQKKSYKAWIRTCTPTDTFMTEVLGTGIDSRFQIATKHINFGKLTVGEHRDTMATILRNTGNVPIVVSHMANYGPDIVQFSILSYNKPVTIVPGDSLRVKIRFSSKYRGKTSGSLQLKVQGSNDASYINLSGEGLAAREVWIVGRTLSSNDSLPLQAKVNCYDLASCSTVKSMGSGKDGKFSFKISTDRNYGVTAEKQGYLSSSENVDIREATLTDTIKRNIYLTNLTAGASIRMNCIFFEYAKATLLESSKSDLARITDLLNAQKTMIVELQGHTDSIGSDKSNMVLAEQRAKAIRNYLINQHISPERLLIKAYGRSKPVATNKTEEGRQLNRRVELKILKN